jgi:hypothetical protein
MNGARGKERRRETMRRKGPRGEGRKKTKQRKQREK